MSKIIVSNIGAKCIKDWKLDGKTHFEQGVTYDISNTITLRSGTIGVELYSNYGFHSIFYEGSEYFDVDALIITPQDE